jgi:hypothetical protein
MFSRILSLSFAFTLFFVSILSSKLVRLLVYWDSVPLQSFIIYLPTCLLVDYAFLTIFRVLVHCEKVVACITGVHVGMLLS